MASHVYHEIFPHFNWHTKSNAALLRGRVEEETHRQVLDKGCRIKGVSLIELGGTDDHVHLAIRIAPFVTVSDLVQELKGASSHEVNKVLGTRTLEWQRGYGVVSFGRRHLEWVRDYIRRQREHHAKGSAIARLELCEEADGDWRGGAEAEAEEKSG
ncbi:MAG: IS200/IS605 family transposase [Phycisphaerales bacterium]|nr:IS200/IS605 family transposase [Phycisphaerales bacterium]